MPETCAPSMGDPADGSALHAARGTGRAGGAPVRVIHMNPVLVPLCRTAGAAAAVHVGTQPGSTSQHTSVFAFVLFYGTAGAVCNGVRAKEASSGAEGKAGECSGRSPGARRAEAHVPVSAVPAAT